MGVCEIDRFHKPLTLFLTISQHLRYFRPTIVGIGCIGGLSFGARNAHTNNIVPNRDADHRICVRGQ